MTQNKSKQYLYQTSMNKKMDKICSDSVFIEKDQHLQMDKMKEIFKSGSSEDIKNMFFPFGGSSELNISGIAENQVRKHSKVLNHKNRTFLKRLLKHRNETGQMASEFKGLNEHKTNFQGDEADEQIQQYLSLNEVLDF